MSKIVKNYIFNTLYQMIIFIFPFAIIPYLSKTIGGYNLGIFAFADAVTQYFVLITCIGTGIYGNRAIAYLKDNFTERSKLFGEIVYLKVITGIICTLAYLIIVICFLKDHKLIYVIFSLNIINAIFDISWFYIGLEELKKVVLRNFAVRFLIFLSVFWIVKTPKDLWLYSLIFVLSGAIGNILMWLPLKQYINPTISLSMDIKKIFFHLKSTMPLFLSGFLVQVFTLQDKTLLGLLSNPSEVFYFDTTIRVVRASLFAIASVGLAVMPRISSLVAEGNFEQIKKYNNLTLKFVCLISIPMFFGLFGIADNFVTIFLGKGYYKVALLMKICSALFIILSLNNVIVNNVIYPFKKDKFFLKVLFGAAFLNILFNLILIPHFKSVATAISIVLTELFIIIILFLFNRDFFDFKKSLPEFAKFIIASILFYITIHYLNYLNCTIIIKLLIQFVSSMIIYFGMLILLKSNTIFSILDKLKIWKKTTNEEQIPIEIIVADQGINETI